MTVLVIALAVVGGGLELGGLWLVFRDIGRDQEQARQTAAAAKSWRRDMQVNIARGEVHASVTVAEAYERWIEKVHAGEVRARGGQLYKPGFVHTYQLAFTGRLLKQFGNTEVGDLRRADVQRYVDGLIAEGRARADRAQPRDRAARPHEVVRPRGADRREPLRRTGATRWRQDARPESRRRPRRWSCSPRCLTPRTAR